MIEYEWARNGTKFIAYVNDTITNMKMVTVGLSHKTIRHNFGIMLMRAGKTNEINARRYLQANDSNPLLLEKFGNLKRGGFLPKDFDIKSSKQIRFEKIERERKDRQEFEKFKAQKAKTKKASSPVVNYDAYFTRTEGDVVKVYGVKLVQEFKSKIQLADQIKLGISNSDQTNF